MTLSSERRQNPKKREQGRKRDIRREEKGGKIGQTKGKGRKREFKATNAEVLQEGAYSNKA